MRQKARLFKEFNRLVFELRKAGYTVDVSSTQSMYLPPPYARTAVVTGHGIRACFGEGIVTQWYNQHCGRIAANRVESYDRPQNCPLVMSIDDPEEIIKCLKYLGDIRSVYYTNR